MLAMSASVNRLRLAAIVLTMVLILTITILPSADNAHYVRDNGTWKVEPENRWYEFTFKLQSTTSFTPTPYGGSSSLRWNPYLRLVSVTLAPFRTNLHIKSFEVYQPNKGRFGVSDTVYLGQAEFANYNDRGITLGLAGSFRNSIAVGPELNGNDYCRPIGSYVVPIPKSVEVRAEGGTPL